MASIDDLGALVDEGLLAVDNEDIGALKRVVTKSQIIIALLAPDVSTDQTFISYRTSAGLLADALETMKTMQSGGIRSLGAEF